MPNVEQLAPTPTSNPKNSALDVFFRIADLWQLTTDQQIKLLGSPGRSTFFKWKKDGGQISPDTEERISHLASIFKALQITVPDAKAADTWLHRPNKFFDGRSALDVMLDGKVTDIFRVRSYLDAQRGG
jgi:uncharacterized protein (DUF2384 family)